MIVTSFYTPTWEYPAHAERLAAECDALGLDCWIAERPDMGGYLANCRQKPHHIRGAMSMFGRSVLWLDVDASILRAPDVPDVDFAAVPMPETRDRTWHVGTLYFGTRAPARRLVDLWIAALDEESSDEAALDRAWVRWAGGIAALSDDYHNVENRRETDDPVVMHRLSKSEAKYDAHRRLRGLV